MNQLLEWIYRALESVLTKIGLGKTDFFALAMIVINILIFNGWLPETAKDWFSQPAEGMAGGAYTNILALNAALIGLIGLGLRDSVRKAVTPSKGTPSKESWKL